MAADLSARGMFQGRELLLDDDALIDLQNGFGSDRIRRVLFERVQSVIAWTHILGGRLAFSIVLLVVGSIFLIPLSQGDASPLTAFGIIFVILGLIFTFRYLIFHRYYLVIRMIDGSEHRMVSIARPAKFQHFIKRLTNRILAYQSAESERRTTAIPGAAPREVLLPDE